MVESLHGNGNQIAIEPHDVDGGRVSSCGNSTVMGTDVVEVPRTALGTKTYFTVLILLSVTVHTLPKICTAQWIIWGCGDGMGKGTNLAGMVA